MSQATFVKTTATEAEQKRREDWQRLMCEEFDLLIIGGGITGAAVAQAASNAGLKVALVEKRDFANGTSSKSTRLIHGGLRYLKNGAVSLVYRALREQKALARAAPHLVRPVSLLLPLYHKTRVGRLGYKAGMFFYRALQPLANKSGYAYTPEDLRQLEPLLTSAGLQGGYVCREYLTHDARLVLETLLAAQETGACVLNYVNLLDFLVLREGRVAGAAVRDERAQQTGEVRAKVVVNTTGPWSDEVTQTLSSHTPSLRLTKGVHVIVPRRLFPLAHGVIFPSRRDGRGLVALPHANAVTIGPTETVYEGVPNEVKAEAEDIAYLLEAVADFFPEVALRRADVAATRAGLRPLYASKSSAVGQISRHYHTAWQCPGLLNILGGKLTLHRQAAASVLRLLSKDAWCVGQFAKLSSVEPKLGQFSKLSHKLLLPGARWDVPREAIYRQLRERDVSAVSAQHLLATYGSRAVLLVALLDEEPQWNQRFTPTLPHLQAEAVFARRYEMALEPDDFLTRRSDLQLFARIEGHDLRTAAAHLWGM